MPCFIVGLLIACLYALLFVLAGENIIVAPHDQLDNVVDSWLLAIKHINEPIAPEMMNGVSVAEIKAGSFVDTCLFTILPDYVAYAVEQLLIMAISYIGMYLTLKELEVHPILSMITALCFASLPFYTAFGLSAMGIPLVALAAIRIWKNPTRINLVIGLCLTALFVIWSSLILAGFFLIALLVFMGFACLTKDKSRRAGACYLSLAGSMLLLYLITHPILFTIAAKATGEENTRAEMVPSHMPFNWDAIWTFFTEGHYHSLSNQQYLLPLIVISLAAFGIFSLISKLKHVTLDDGYDCARHMAAGVLSLVIGAFLIAVFYCAFSSRLGIELRSYLPGSLSSFQFDRLYYAYPTIWFCAGGLSAELLVRTALMASKAFDLRPLANALVAMSACLAIVIPVVLTERASLFPNHTPVNTNIVAETIIKNYIHPEENDSSALTWKRFYAEDLMNQIREAIGIDQSEYRVISVGLYPNIAMHSGFYTLDGYRGYYSLDYKHEFRKIIAGELAMDEELRVYFDEWGSRCYAFSHEVGQNYTVPKDSELEIRDLRFDLGQLKRMGGDYIISAVPIIKPEQYGLSTVGDFETDDSYYHLYVYENTHE